MFTPNRKIKGEELHGMDIEELQKLEKVLDVGLSRVTETKAHLSFLSLFAGIIMECWNLCTLSKYKILFCLSAWKISGRDHCTSAKGHVPNFKSLQDISHNYYNVCKTEPEQINALKQKVIWFQWKASSYFSDDPLHNDIMVKYWNIRWQEETKRSWKNTRN